jgi:glycolate oxidase iron-sulfur subunit
VDTDQPPNSDNAQAQGDARPVLDPTALDPTGELADIVSDCVHCGFCLPSCPTYQLWGEEMDSPRGRIHLIGQLLDGAVAGEAAASHLDRCLGCMACVPACPSGVRYDRLIEAARAWAAEPVQSLPPRSARERALRTAIFSTFPYPRRLRVLMTPLRAAQRTRVDRLMARSAAADRLAPELTAALRVAPGRSASKVPRGRLPERVAAWGERRAVVGLLTGCVQQVFFPQVNIATARVLAAEGCDVVIPRTQGCCGALSLHDGRRAEAAKFAAALIETFERAEVDVIVVNSAGCGSAMKEYADLLADDHALADRAAALSERVRDLSEFLVRLGPAATRHPLPISVAYHDACHLAHAQRITSQPRELLTAIPGLSLVEVADAGTCCGSAGIYNLVQPATARELGARKATAVSATGADLVVSGNPGCALQIASALAEASPGRRPPGTPRGAGPRMPVAHLAEVLDVSIRAKSATALL